jgi:hypothetical protein
MAKHMTAEEIEYWEQLNNQSQEQQFEQIQEVAEKGKALFAAAVAHEDEWEWVEAEADAQGAQLKAHDRHGGRAGGRSMHCVGRLIVLKCIRTTMFAGSRATMGGGGGGSSSSAGKFSGKGVRAALARQQMTEKTPTWE